MRIAIAAGVVIIGTAAVAGTAYWLASPSAARQPDLQRGAAIYADYCASCHGANLEGQSQWRVRNPDGKLPAPPHDETGHTWHHPDKQLFAITKFGSEALIGNDYRSDMIGFGDVLTDDEIWDVLAFIKSKWPDRERRRQEQITKQNEGGR